MVVISSTTLTTDVAVCVTPSTTTGTKTLRGRGQVSSRLRRNSWPATYVEGTAVLMTVFTVVTAPMLTILWSLTSASSSVEGTLALTHRQPASPAHAAPEELASESPPVRPRQQSRRVPR